MGDASRCSLPGGRLPGWAAVGALTVLLGACGAEDSEVVSAPVQAEVATAAAETAAPEAAASGGPSTALSLASFQMPSGAIGCSIDDAGVTCGVRGARWAPPPRPASCEGDWGQSVALDRARARFVCATDTPVEPDAPVLAYGTQSRVDGYVCTSTEQALRCEHGAGGHGFTLSRSAYDLF
ncbi:MAG: DUF6636 domain-containing protein [Sporichthyaceae bacterium]